jgi:hypothetical protein
MSAGSNWFNNNENTNESHSNKEISAFVGFRAMCKWKKH